MLDRGSPVADRGFLGALSVDQFLSGSLTALVDDSSPRMWRSIMATAHLLGPEFVVVVQDLWLQHRRLGRASAVSPIGMAGLSSAHVGSGAQRNNLLVLALDATAARYHARQLVAAGLITETLLPRQHGRRAFIYEAVEAAETSGGTHAA